MPECQCENAGWCDLFKKEMTYDPPNWQWCKSLSEDQRCDYFNKMESTVRVLKKAPDEKKADIVNFFDILPEKKSKYAVCVIPANDSAMELLDITRAGVKKYAEKCGADYIELSGDQNPDWPMSNKYRLNRVAKAYDKTLYLDCDIVVKDDAPNIFELTPDDKISAYDEYEIFKQRNDTEWIRNQQEHIFTTTLDSFSDDIKEKYITNGEFITESMINGGVLVIPNALADYYKQPSTPYTKFWCFDQHLLTLELPEEKFNNLTHEFNCEYVQNENDFIYKSYDSYFIHINSLKELKLRKLLLQNFTKKDQATSGKICLIPCGLRYGGVESWHKQIAKILNPHRIAAYFEAENMWLDIFKDYDFNVGREAAISAANSCGIIINWLLGCHNPSFGGPDIPPFMDIIKNVRNFTEKKFINVIHTPTDWEYLNASKMNFGKTVCVSEGTRSGYINFLRKNKIEFKEENILTIEDGPDSDRIKTNLSRLEARKLLGIEDDEILLLSCARMHPQKNIEAIVDAFNLLPKKYKLILVGVERSVIDFDYNSGWEAHIKQFDSMYSNMESYKKLDKLYLDYVFDKIVFSNKNIKILPFRDNIGDLLVATDIYLQPSRFEGYGLSVVEAMLYKIPVIGTNVGILKKIPSFQIPNQKVVHSKMINSESVEIDPSDLKYIIEYVTKNRLEITSIIEECYDTAVNMEINFKKNWIKLIREV